MNVFCHARKYFRCINIDHIDNCRSDLKLLCLEIDIVEYWLKTSHKGLDVNKMDSFQFIFLFILLVKMLEKPN